MPLWDASRLEQRLNGILFKLADGVTRRSVGAPDPILIDGDITSVDQVMDIDGLMDVIHEWMVERASRPGVAL